jgi:small GTP-binding protein
MPAGGRPPDTTLSLKISLAGESGVGKTSLVRRFVSDTFDDSYIATLGAKISSRRFSIPDPRATGKTVEVAAAIWDIMGHRSLGEVLGEAYFHRAQGVLLVADATRQDTFNRLPSWAHSVTSIAGRIPIVVLVNKSDLAEQAKITPDQVQALCSPKGWNWMKTSAKTGENVTVAFEMIARLHLAGLPSNPSAPPSAS